MDAPTELKCQELGRISRDAAVASMRESLVEIMDTLYARGNVPKPNKAINMEMR